MEEKEHLRNCKVTEKKKKRKKFRLLQVKKKVRNKNNIRNRSFPIDALPNNSKNYLIKTNKKYFVILTEDALALGIFQSTSTSNDQPYPETM